MTRQAPSFSSPDDSDVSFVPQSDDDLSDADDVEPSDYETDPTDLDDLSVHDPEDPDIDLEDQGQLFGGNLHPPEYYRHGLEDFNEEAYDSQDYSPGTTLLLDAIENQWHEYVCITTLAIHTNSDSRFCKFLGREPTECYKSLSIKLLYSFFDWRLNQKLGKDGRIIRGTKKKSSLGTYWKVFRLMFERATGEKVDPKMNRGMHKVFSLCSRLISTLTHLHRYFEF
jgi:hypothetical protein